MEIRTLEPLTADRLAENAMTIHRAMAVCRAHGFEPVAADVLIKERGELAELRGYMRACGPRQPATLPLVAITAPLGPECFGGTDEGSHYCAQTSAAKLRAEATSSADPDTVATLTRTVETLRAERDEARAEDEHKRKSLNAIIDALGVTYTAPLDDIVAEIERLRELADVGPVARLSPGERREVGSLRSEHADVCEALGLPDDASAADIVREIEGLTGEADDVRRTLGIDGDATTLGVVREIERRGDAATDREMRLRTLAAQLDALVRRGAREIPEPRTRAAILADLDAAMAEGGCEGVALDGAALIAAERRSQLAKWPADHDDEHGDGSLAVVAATLTIYGTDARVHDPNGRSDGFGRDCWGLAAKHPNPARRLAIAGALVAAEIDRVQRREAAGCPLASEEVRGG